MDYRNWLLLLVVLVVATFTPVHSTPKPTHPPTLPPTPSPPTPKPTHAPTLPPTPKPTKGPPTPKPTKPPPTPGPTPVPITNGLLGYIFSGPDFGAWDYCEYDDTINFNFGGSGPGGPGVGGYFSAMWVGSVIPEANTTYTFYVEAKDGCNLTVNGEELVSDWTIQPLTTKKANITLTAGLKYYINLKYFCATQNCKLQLFWSSPLQAKQIIPEKNLVPAPLITLNPFPLYLGCFYDKSPKHDLSTLLISAPNMTIPYCIKQCYYANYTYFGLQDGTQCWCGNSYGSYGQAPDSDCNVPCPTDPANNCGAPQRNSIYEFFWPPFFL